MKDDEVQVLWQCISDLDTIGNFKSRWFAHILIKLLMLLVIPFTIIDRLLQSVDCSFIYWHKVTFPIYLNCICDNPPECFKLKVGEFY